MRRWKVALIAVLALALGFGLGTLRPIVDRPPLVVGQNAALHEMIERALLLLTFLRWPISTSWLRWALSAPAHMRGDAIDYIALQFLGIIEDQDHLKRAVANEAPLQLRRSRSHRIGIVPLAPGVGRLICALRARRHFLGPKFAAK